jgi:PAS domain S-box-containing protein
MTTKQPPFDSLGHLFVLSAELNRVETVETAITRTIELVETVFDQPVVSVCAYDTATNSVVALESSVSASARVDCAPDRIPESLIHRADERADGQLVDQPPKATIDTDPQEPIRAKALVPVGRDRVLRVGVTELERLDEAEIATIEGIAANLETALSRIDRGEPATVECDVARALFDQSDDAAFVSDTDGTLVAVNRAAVELTGRDQKALLRSGLPGVSADTAAEAVREHLESTVAGTSEPFTTTLKHAHEGDLTVELTSRQVDVDGTSYVRTTAHDSPSDAESQPARLEDPVEDDTAALRRLSELTVGAEELDETIERLLSLGCDYFGLDTGILSHVDGDDYEVGSVVDATGTHEAGAVYDLGDMMCDATLTGDGTGPLAFADVEDTDHQNHSAAESARAYIGAPVVVDGETHGTVNFSMGRPRAEAFRPEEREFVKLVAGWIGTEIERRHRSEELERYETVLEAVGDPVYALDAEGRFTYVNEAAKREFGYGEEVIGERPSVAMNESDVKQVRERIEGLTATDERSTTAEFELETADGGRKLVENRFAMVGDDELRGTAGVLRDITARKERERQLESFQRAVESSRDGVAILDSGEYEYVDQTHVDMYGFEDKEQLLGNTWRTLYDDEEAERLEAEAFPALESEGYWCGDVTGSRPDGTTFPAELSLTIVDDGRLVCTVRDETERRERERELELKERAMDEASVGIQITDPTQEDNPLTYVNDGFERITGYAREDALGRNPRFLQGEDTGPEQMTRLREAINTEEAVSLELRNVRKDGTPYWSRLSVTPVSDETGAVRNFIGVQQDVTERKEGERRAEARQDFLKRIYEVTADPELSFEEKITGLLEAGRDHLDLPYGFLTHIESDDEGGSETQTIVEALGSHERLQPGESAPLGQSYCRKTIERGGSMALTHAAEAGWADDLAHEVFGLETYVGSEVVAGDETYGTLCFASKEPRDHSFDEFERSFIRLAARWAGYEIDRRNTREELREQRERLELALSGTNTGLVEWDLETGAVTWNETLVDIVGRNVGSLDEFRTALHPDDRDRVKREMETMVETGDPWVGKFRMLDGDGDTLWLGTWATPVYNDGEEPVRVLATGTDISDKMQAERERRRNERRFESLFDDPGLLVGLLDTDGRLLDANGTAMEYVDASLEELRGEALWETPWWTHSEEQQADLREWIQRAADGGYVEYTATNRGPDGDRREVTGTVRPVTDQSGTVQSLVISGRDVTDRERQRRELRDRQRKLDLVLSKTNTSIGELNVGDGTLDWPDMVGDNNIGSPETVEGLLETVHPEDRGRLQSDLEAMVDSGEPLDGEYRLVDEDGETIWITGQAILVEEEDEETNSTGEVVGIATDITELKQREQALETSREQYRSLAENVPNGAVLTFDADLEYMLAAGELLSEFGLEESDVAGTEVGEVLVNGEHDIVSRFDAALDGERTDRQVELGDRTLRTHIVPVESGDEESTHIRGLALIQDITDEARRKRELFEERERFRLLTESVDEYTFLVVDEDGVIQTWNENAEDTFGYDAEAAVGMSIAELHPEAEREHDLPDRLLQQARVAGKSAHEGWRVRADGSKFYADVLYAPLKANDGEFRGYATVVRDMTDRRRERRRTERFVEESDDVVTIIDPDGTVTYASGSANRVLGYGPDDLVGENIFDYLHPDGREHAMKTFFTCVEDSKNAKAECRLASPDGGWIDVEGRCRNVLDDDAIDGILVYLRDVTESKKRTRRFEGIFNSTFGFTGLLQPDGTVVEVNETALEFGGFERDAIVGESFFDAPWWTHSEAVRDDVQDAIAQAAGGEFVRYETEVRGADGLATIDFSVKPVIDEDDDVSLLVVEGRDITTLQQHERHLKIMQRVMRHNMRNDLTKIRGWTQMMCEEPDTEKRAEQFEHVEEVLDKWRGMTEKIQEIRTVLESQQGREVWRGAEALVEDAVAPVRKEYAGRTVVTDLPETESQVPATLQDAVHELVENAAKASTAATIEVELDCSVDGWTKVFVRDDGPGMPDIEADVLETGEETPLEHGQGLGLWMVRMIVTQAGGKASVESRDDGTVVCLRLPAKRTVGSERSGGANR